LIEYPEYSQAKAAIQAWDGSELLGKILKCDFAFVRGSGVSKSTQSIKPKRK
jgi:hypothetical protein